MTWTYEECTDLDLICDCGKPVMGMIYHNDQYRGIGCAKLIAQLEAGLESNLEVRDRVLKAMM